MFISSTHCVSKCMYWKQATIACIVTAIQIELSISTANAYAADQNPFETSKKTSRHPEQNIFPN